MAKANLQLVSSIRRAAKKLLEDKKYQWGHMGACNCGFLAQEITKLSKAQIHDFAMKRHGDWTEQSIEYCPSSGYPLDEVISIMLQAGLDIDDFKNLEKLADPEVLRRISQHGQHLKHNKKEDVVLYMLAWADLLEEKYLDKVDIDDASVHPEGTNKLILQI